MLERASPLGAASTPGRHGAADGPAPVLLHETPAAALVQVSTFPGTEGAAAAALAPLGLAPLPGPGESREAVSGTVVTATGPGRWLAIDLHDGTLPVRLADALRAETASVVDLTHARARLIVSGPRARDALAKGVPLDLSGEARPAGSVATTRFAHVTVQIRVLDDAPADPRFELLVMSSFAGSLWSDLVEAAAEWGVACRRHG